MTCPYGRTSVTGGRSTMSGPAPGVPAGALPPAPAWTQPPPALVLRPPALRPLIPYHPRFSSANPPPISPCRRRISSLLSRPPAAPAFSSRWAMEVVPGITVDTVP